MSAAPRHTWRYLATALALGPLFALALLCEAEALAVFRFSTPFLGMGLLTGFGLELLASNALIAGLASIVVSWWMRRSVLGHAPRDRAVVALGCALLGGPTFGILYFLVGVWGRALPFLSSAPESWGEWLLSALLGGSLLGIVLGPLFLPVTWPVTWLGVGLLRRAGGPPEPAPTPESGRAPEPSA